MDVSRTRSRSHRCRWNTSSRCAPSRRWPSRRDVRGLARPEAHRSRRRSCTNHRLLTMRVRGTDAEGAEGLTQRVVWAHAEGAEELTEWVPKVPARVPE